MTIRNTAVAEYCEPLDRGIIPAAHYISKEFLEAEKEYMWPFVWTAACREEEIPTIGDYITYELLDDSIIVVRTAVDQIRAYHNVCPHRGRRITSGCGHANTFRCNFHGWRWDISGRVSEVLDRESWGGTLDDEALNLKPVRVDTWGGFVFVNLDASADPLHEYLAPVPEYAGHYDYERMRYLKYRTFKLPCNWKVALEAFNEAYHVAGTHPQLLQFYDDRTSTQAFGKHAMMGQAKSETGMRAMGQPSLRLRQNEPADARKLVVGFYKHMHAEFGATYTNRDAEAAHRLLTELPANATPQEVSAKFVQIRREVSEAMGAGWPETTPEQLARGGLIWHVFPNLIINATFNAAAIYRARPDSKDPDMCVFDVWSLQRFTLTAEPPLKREYVDDWTQCKDLGLILTQDFTNIPEVQKGMKSRAFAGARPSPTQEETVFNFHSVLRDYIRDGVERANA